MRNLAGPTLSFLFMPKSYAAIQESEEASIAESFTPAEYEQLKTMFSYFDTDSDRMLSIKEAINLWGLLGYTTSAYDISKFGHDKINLTSMYPVAFIRFSLSVNAISSVPHTIAAFSFLHLPLNELETIEFQKQT